MRCKWLFFFFFKKVIFNWICISQLAASRSIPAVAGASRIQSSWSVFFFFSPGVVMAKKRPEVTAFHDTYYRAAWIRLLQIDGSIFSFVRRLYIPSVILFKMQLYSRSCVIYSVCNNPNTATYFFRLSRGRVYVSRWLFVTTRSTLSYIVIATFDPFSTPSLT